MMLALLLIQELRLTTDEWGADSKDVLAVLNSTAAEVRAAFPERKLPAIEVSPRGGPIVLYQRTAEGALQLKLNVKGLYWSQYAFQFSHELCHVHAGFRDEADKRNEWLEESLCETASLFTLRRLAKAWEREPPYPNWKSYAPAFARYADERLAGAKLPEGTTFVRWFRDNVGALEKNHNDRERALVVAAALLPLFEEKPETWGAVAHLNAPAAGDGKAFETFLREWRDACPAEVRPAVGRVSAVFEVTLP